MNYQKGGWQKCFLICRKYICQVIMFAKKENLLFVSSSYLRLLNLFDEISAGSAFLESFLYRNNPLVAELSKDCHRLFNTLESNERKNHDMMLCLSKNFEKALIDFLQEDTETQSELFSTAYSIEDVDLFLEIVYDLTPCQQRWNSISDFTSIFNEWINTSYMTYKEHYQLCP